MELQKSIVPLFPQSHITSPICIVLNPDPGGFRARSAVSPSSATAATESGCGKRASRHELSPNMLQIDLQIRERSPDPRGRDFYHFFEDITKRPDFIYLGKKETRSSPKHLLKKTQSSRSTFPGRSQLKTFGFFLKSEGFLLTIVGIEHTSVLFVQRAVRMCIYICICLRPSNNAFFI